MSYKSLQQLRDEQEFHHRRALRLMNEAAEILEKMQFASSHRTYDELHRQWTEKEAQARVEIAKSIELTKQFIQELERLRNRDLN